MRLLVFNFLQRCKMLGVIIKLYSYVLQLSIYSHVPVENTFSKYNFPRISKFFFYFAFKPFNCWIPHDSLYGLQNLNWVKPKICIFIHQKLFSCIDPFTPITVTIKRFTGVISFLHTANLKHYKSVQTNSWPQRAREP